MRGSVNKSTKWIVATALVAICGLMGLSVYARWDGASEPAATPREVGYDPATGVILVDLDDDASDAELRAIGQQIDEAIAPFDWPDDIAALGEELSDPANLYAIRPPVSERDDVLRALSDDDVVEVVEVERAWSVPMRAAWSPVGSASAPTPSDDSDRFVPDDPYYGYQWHLDQIGMPRAWTQNRGSGAVVAIIDTGVAHREGGGFLPAPDLEGVTFVPGYDFVDRDEHPDDEHGHGTHVAGTVAQTTNNGVGVARRGARSLDHAVEGSRPKREWRLGRNRGRDPLCGGPRRGRDQYVPRWRNALARGAARDRLRTRKGGC